MGNGTFGAMVQLSAEYSLRLVQFAAHVHVLRSLTGKHEDSAGNRRGSLPGENQASHRLIQQRARFFGGGSHNRATMRKWFSAQLAGVGNILQGQLSVLLQV